MHRWMAAFPDPKNSETEDNEVIYEDWGETTAMLQQFLLLIPGFSCIPFVVQTVPRSSVWNSTSPSRQTSSPWSPQRSSMSFVKQMRVRMHQWRWFYIRGSCTIAHLFNKHNLLTCTFFWLILTPWSPSLQLQFFHHFPQILHEPTRNPQIFPMFALHLLARHPFPQACMKASACQTDRRAGFQLETSSRSPTSTWGGGISGNATGSCRLRAGSPRRTQIIRTVYN